MNKKMKELPESERPYEKCLNNGEQALSDSELLAIILRCGTKGNNSLLLAQDILSYMDKSAYPGLLGILHMSIKDLMEIKGIGKIKAIQLKCIGELSKRIASKAAKENLTFDNPISIAQYYMEKLRHEEQELLYCMMLDNRNHLLAESQLSRGTVNSALITPREIFIEALKFHAVSLILVHNHPSGDPTPSKCDIEITKRVLETGEMIGIQVLDHIIIGDQKYVSFREQEIL